MPTGARMRLVPLLLAGVIVLGGLAVVELFRSPPVAAAQIPDSGYQRQVMIRELQQINAKLDKVTKLLTEIRDLTAAKAKGGRTRPPKRP